MPGLSLDPIPAEFERGDRLEFLEPHGQLRQPLNKGAPPEALSLMDQRGQEHAHGRKHSAVLVDVDRADVEQLGHPASVLGSRPPEGRQDVVPGVVALALGDRLDGAGHLLVGDLDVPLSQFLH
jgi:hypothetical protein